MSVREALGIQITGGQVFSLYPAEEVAKGLRRVTGDLRTGTVKVKDVYDLVDREKYISNLPKDDLPEPSTALAEPIALPDLLAGNTGTKAKRPKKAKVKRSRTAVVPSDCLINPGPPRMNAIYNELLNLNADTFPNACVVLVSFLSSVLTMRSIELCS